MSKSWCTDEIGMIIKVIGNAGDILIINDLGNSNIISEETVMNHLIGERVVKLEKEWACSTEETSEDEY